MIRLLSLCVLLSGPVAFAQAAPSRAQAACDCAGGKCDSCKKDGEGRCTCGKSCQAAKACRCGDEQCTCKKCECTGGPSCSHKH